MRSVEVVGEALMKTVVGRSVGQLAAMSVSQR